MKNLKVKMKRNELEAAGRFMVAVFNNYEPQTIYDSSHRLNLQSLCIKFINKRRATSRDQPYKMVPFVVNVNEVISLEYIINQTQAVRKMDDVYLWVIFTDLITTVKKHLEYELNYDENYIMKFQ